MLYVALFATLSCNRESDQLFESKETHKPDAVARYSKGGYDFENSKITPLWEGAIYLKNFIEVPYLFDGKLPRPQAQKGGIKNQGRERLLISTQGAEFKMYIVRYIPSSSFKGDINKINSQNFKEQKFDGVVTLKKVGEEGFETFKVRNGKIVKQTKVTKSNSKKNGRTSSSYYVCELWAQNTHYYQRLENGELIYMYTETEYGQDCFYFDDGNGDGPGEGPGDGSGVDPFDCSTSPNHPLCGGSGGGGDFGGGNPPFNDYMNDPTYASFIEQLNAAERAWFLKHPERIPAAVANKWTAEVSRDNKYRSDISPDNNNANAFKHALWSALNAWAWGANAARELGDLHELSNSTPNQRTMDLHNNNLGIDMARGINNGDGQQLTENILHAIANGQGLRLTGSDANGDLIPTNGTERR